MKYKEDRKRVQKEEERLNKQQSLIEELDWEAEIEHDDKEVNETE
jgi:hypothetical protein